jgi:hypothetical protein
MKMKDEERNQRNVQTAITINKQKQTYLQNAEEQQDEEIDDVKEMNRKVIYAKCVTIRDQQLDETKYKIVL